MVIRPGNALKVRWHYWVCLVSVLLLAVPAVFFPPVFLQLLENKSFDFRFLLRGERPVGDEIVIVGVDDRSLEGIGRWPWPRHQSAALIADIAQAGAAVIGVDMIFSEPDQEVGAAVIGELLDRYAGQAPARDPFLAYLRDMREQLREDAIFARAIREAGNVVLPIGMLADKGVSAQELPDVMYDFPFMIVKEREYSAPVVAHKALLPIDDFAYEALSLGHVYTQYDADGTIRWEPLAMRMGEFHFPSFSLEIARAYLGHSREAMQLVAGEAVVLDEQVVDTDAHGRVLINYAGPAGTFTTISAIDVLQGLVDPAVFKDKVVLLAVTALGGTDIHVTPYSHMPGVEKQATVLENILHQRFLHSGEFTKSGIVSFILVAGVVFLLAIPHGAMVNGTIAAIALLLLYWFVTQYLFVQHLMRVDLITPVLAVLLMYSSMTAVRFLIEERQAKAIRNLFSNYTTEKVVNELIARPELARLGGSNREVTVLFSDVRGFTSFSESRSPEEIVHYLNELLTAMTEVIFEWDGTLDKFVGDEIMAFWGAPAEQLDHAELATGCAISMLRRLKILHEKWAREGVEPLDIGIGLNSGEVLVGNIGCEAKKMDYTIIGDHVNLGARVEALTRNYNAHIIITEFTLEKIAGAVRTHGSGECSLQTAKGEVDHLFLKALGGVKVKGKEKPVEIHEIGNTQT